MRLFRHMTVLFAVTIMALAYVHQQVETVKLSYALESREKRLKDILDRNDSLEYNIKNLEDPSRLEKILLSKNIDISFPKRRNVVKMTGASSGVVQAQRLRSSGIERKPNLLNIVDFFGQIREAQARER